MCLDYLDHAFVDRWFDVTWFFDLSLLMPYWGIFMFWMRFIDFHEVACLSPFARYMLRWWHVHYFMTILQCNLFGVIQPDLLYNWWHTGAYFHFKRDLQISMELYDHSHLRDVHRDDDLFTIVMMISQWSLSRAIQLGTHFSALRCHHAPPSEICILDLWAWLCYGFRWPGLHICWCMT